MTRAHQFLMASAWVRDYVAVMLAVLVGVVLDAVVQAVVVWGEE